MRVSAAVDVGRGHRHLGLASLVSDIAFQTPSPDTIAFPLAFAAGAIIGMLADTMMQQAYQHGRKLVGVITTLGFSTALLIHTPE